MLTLPDSEPHVGDTHAYIIQCTSVAHANRQVTSTHPPSPEWERVVRAVTTSVLTSLQTSWPEISLVGSTPGRTVRGADPPRPSERTGPPNVSAQQPRPNGVSSHQPHQPATSNNGGGDRAHNRSETASTVSPPLAAASRTNSEAFEVDHLQVFRELRVATGEATHGGVQRGPPGMENAIRNAATQVVRNGVRAGLAAAAVGQPFPFADVSTHPTRPLPSPQEARRETVNNGGGPPRAHATPCTLKRDPSPMNAQEENEATRRSNIRPMNRTSASGAEQPAQRSRTSGACSARRHAFDASSTSNSDLSGDAMEENEVERPLNDASKSPRDVGQRLNLRKRRQAPAGVPQDPRQGRTQLTRASRPVANRTAPTGSAPQRGGALHSESWVRSSPAQGGSQLGVRPREQARRHTLSPARNRERSPDHPPPSQRHRGESAAYRLADDRRAWALFRLSSMIGSSSMIIDSDVPLLRVRHLSEKEVRRSGQGNLEVPDLSWWGELRLESMRFCIVAVLHRDSVMTCSRINSYDAIIAGMQLQPPMTPAPSTAKHPCGKQAEVVSVHNLPDERFLPYPFKIVMPTEFFVEMENEVGTGKVSCLESGHTGDSSSPARNRIRNAGLLTEDMHRYQNRHAKPLNSGELGKLPAMIAFVYDHLDLTVQPREGIQQEVRAYIAEQAGRPQQGPATRRSQKTWVNTLDDDNSLPSATVLMHAGGETHCRQVKVYIDVLPQSFLMSASEFIRPEGTEKLARISSHREEVNETIACTDGTVRIVTVLAELTCLLKMQDGAFESMHVRVTWKISENRITHDWNLMRSSVPRTFFIAYAAEVERSRSRDPVSTAFFAEEPSGGDC